MRWCPSDPCRRSLQSSLRREKTHDKERAQRLLDLEINSVVSKEYDPTNLKIRGVNSLVRMSQPVDSIFNG